MKRKTRRKRGNEDQPVEYEGIWISPNTLHTVPFLREDERDGKLYSK